MWEKERENAVPGWFPEVFCRAVKEKREERIRDKRERGCKKRTGWSPRRLVVVAHLSDSHSLSQPGNAGCLEHFATSSAHAQSTPAAAPVLVFVVDMANCALDWSVLVARRQEAVMGAITLDLGERHGWRVCITGRLEWMAEISVCDVDVEVEVCIGGHVWECCV